MLNYTEITQNTYIPKLNGYGDNDHRKVGACVVSTYCSLRDAIHVYCACSELDDCVSRYIECSELDECISS